jgi:hypothetical protein
LRSNASKHAETPHKQKAVVSEERDRASVLWKKSKAPVETLDALKKTLTSDLIALKRDLKSDNWGDETLMIEHERLRAAMETATASLSGIMATHRR